MKQLTYQSALHLASRWVRLVLQQTVHGHDKARRAETTLCSISKCQLLLTNECNNWLTEETVC